LGPPKPAKTPTGSESEGAEAKPAKMPTGVHYSY
jgi:hypothetical protein